MTTGATEEEEGEEGVQYIQGRSTLTDTMSAPEKVLANQRIALLRLNGAIEYLQTEPAVLYDLVRSDLSNDDMVDAWLTGLNETQAIAGVESFKENTEGFQRAAFEVFDTRTQEYLKSYGYQLPHDHIDWWNPGDWAQWTQQKFGFKGKNLATKAATSPGWILAQGTQSISDLIKTGWHGVEMSERFSMRTQRANIDATKSAKAGTGQPGIPGFILGFNEYWDNSEYHNASFTSESKQQAYDLLGSEENFNILISIYRYGGPKEGVYEHFVAKNGGDTAAAMAAMQDFLASEIPLSANWTAASEILDEGSTNAAQHALMGFEEMVYKVPEYFGGLRGQPDAPLSDAAGFWTKGYAISGFSGEMLGSIIFEPLNVIDIALASRRASRIRAGVTAGTSKNWPAEIREFHLSAAGLRAYDNALRVAREGADVETAISVGGAASRVTNGMFIDAEQGIRKNFLDWATDAVSGETDDWLAKTSIGQRRQLRKINTEIDLINEAFRRYNVWKLDSIKAASSNAIFLWFNKDCSV